MGGLYAEGNDRAALAPLRYAINNMV